MLRGYDEWKTRAPELEEFPPHDAMCERCGLLDEAPRECEEVDHMTLKERQDLDIAESPDGEYVHATCGWLVYLQPQPDAVEPCRCRGGACYC